MNNLHSELLVILKQHKTSDFYLGSAIPIEKLNNAVAYFPIGRKETVIGLIDCTVFGSCKVGMAITNNGLIWKNEWFTESSRTLMTWEDLVATEDTIRADGSDVVFAAGIIFGMTGSTMKPAEFISLCFSIIEFLVSKNIGIHTPKAKRQNNSSVDKFMVKILMITMIAKFVKSDGAITRNEISFVEDFIDGITDHNAEDKKILINAFNTSKNDNHSIYKIAETFTKIPDLDADDILGIYDLLWNLALVDGTLNPIKENILKEIPNHLGLPQSVFEAASAEYLSDEHEHDNSSSMSHASHDNNFANYYRILGCDPRVSDAELKMAYKRKLSALHPDKLQSKGLADELMQFATQQVQKINEAYENIVNYRRT